MTSKETTKMTLAFGAAGLAAARPLRRRIRPQ